jgi:hypothetical protein
MKSGGGKQKGGSFEREICKKLSEWVSNGKSDDLFWRSAMSGGRATVRKKKNQETASGQGDITAVTPAGNKLTDRYVVECKHYKSMGLDQHVYGQGPLEVIWDKLIKECVGGTNSKKPMLIFKENRKPILIGLDRPIKGIVGLAVYWSDICLYRFEGVLCLNFDTFIKNE